MRANSGTENGIKTYKIDKHIKMDENSNSLHLIGSLLSPYKFIWLYKISNSHLLHFDGMSWCQSFFGRESSCRSFQALFGFVKSRATSKSFERGFVGSNSLAHSTSLSVEVKIFGANILLPKCIVLRPLVERTTQIVNESDEKIGKLPSK